MAAWHRSNETNRRSRGCRSRIPYCAVVWVAVLMAMTEVKCCLSAKGLDFLAAGRADLQSRAFI
jgi:hypothetical protein